MGQFDTLLRCTLGGTHFQLEDYEWSERPMLKSGIGVIGVETRVTGRGWIEASNVADYAARLDDATANIRVSGQDFRIYGPGGVLERSLLAAQCVEGGPHAGYTIGLQGEDGPAFRRITFEVTAQTASDSGGGSEPGVSYYKESIDTAASSLRKITRTGEITHSNATGLFQTVLATFRSTYSAPDFVVTHRHEYDEPNRKLTYAITAEQLAAPLPTAGGGSNIVDGEGRISRRIDEQKRLVLIYSFDLLLDGDDWVPVLDAIRAEAAGVGQIVRESFDFGRFRQHQLSASFEMLMSAEGNKLMNWSHRVSIMKAGDTWEERRFPGVMPFLVKADIGVDRIVQYGSATARGAFVRPPAPLFPEVFLEDPVVDYDVVNDYELVTTWRYVMATDSINPFEFTWAQAETLIRPASPLFIEPPQQGGA